MNNLTEVANESKKGYTPLYYSFSEDAVYTLKAKGRFYVTDLIRENTEDEIKAVVLRWMSL